MVVVRTVAAHFRSGGGALPGQGHRDDAEEGGEALDERTRARALGEGKGEGEAGQGADGEPEEMGGDIDLRPRAAEHRDDREARAEGDPGACWWRRQAASPASTPTRPKTPVEAPIELWPEPW
jgi:hypothetical protein